MHTDCNTWWSEMQSQFKINKLINISAWKLLLFNLSLIYCHPERKREEGTNFALPKNFTLLDFLRSHSLIHSHTRHPIHRNKSISCLRPSFFLFHLHTFPRSLTLGSLYLTHSLECFTSFMTMFYFIHIIIIFIVIMAFPRFFLFFLFSACAYGRKEGDAMKSCENFLSYLQSHSHAVRGDWKNLFYMPTYIHTHILLTPFKLIFMCEMRFSLEHH
jgi:hypothetical protein